MAGWMMMPLGTEVGIGPGHIVLDGDPVVPKGAQPPFSTHVCCGQVAGWIKMSLGTEVGSTQATLYQMGTQFPPPKGPCLL